MLCIRNGRCATGDTLVEKDLWIDDGQIVSEPDAIPDRFETLDASGAFVLPGFIDIHTHLDDVIGGIELADSYDTGTRLALAQGVTTLYSFITQRKNQTLETVVRMVMRKAEGNAHCHLGWHMTPVHFDQQDWKSIKAAIDGGFISIKLYTTYREAGLYSSYDEIDFIASKLANSCARLLIHCEDDESLVPDVKQSGAIAHATMRPPHSEVKAVRRIIETADKFDVPIHVVHVSTAEAAGLINEARQRGIAISCETGPQYLYLNESCLEGPAGHRFLCSPPLRSESIRLQLMDALQDGAIDCLATDHCAFLKSDKDKAPESSVNTPKGLPGIGALVPLAYNFLSKRSSKPIIDLVRLLSENPARIAGIYPRKGCLNIGSDADIVIMNESASVRPVLPSLADVYNPYERFNCSLSVEAVLLKGSLQMSRGTKIKSDVAEGETWQKL